MAKVQMGAIVTGIKGKIAGQVFQGGSNGQILRNKGYTAGQTTSFRQGATGKLSGVTTSWKTLSAGARAAWAAIVAAWTFIDKFGNVYQGSAFQVFTSYNTTLASLGLSQVSVPGAVVSPTNPGIVSFSMDAGTPEVDLDWANAGGAHDYIVVFASAGRSAGKNNNHVRFKKLSAVNINGSTAYVDGGNYLKAWGKPPVGSTVVVKAVFYNSGYPRPSFIQTLSAVAI